MKVAQLQVFCEILKLIEPTEIGIKENTRLVSRLLTGVSNELLSFLKDYKNEEIEIDTAKLVIKDYFDAILNSKNIIECSSFTCLLNDYYDCFTEKGFCHRQIDMFREIEKHIICFLDKYYLSKIQVKIDTNTIHTSAQFS